MTQLMQFTFAVIITKMVHCCQWSYSSHVTINWRFHTSAKSHTIIVIATVSNDAETPLSRHCGVTLRYESRSIVRGVISYW